jgi:hypothetical protein
VPLTRLGAVATLVKYEMLAVKEPLIVAIAMRWYVDAVV